MNVKEPGNPRLFYFIGSLRGMTIRLDPPMGSLVSALRKCSGGFYRILVCLIDLSIRDLLWELCDPHLRIHKSR
jgi:hypothetical protein